MICVPTIRNALKPLFIALGALLTTSGKTAEPLSPSTQSLFEAVAAQRPSAEFPRHAIPSAALSFGHPRELPYLEKYSDESKAVFGGKIEGKVIFFTVITMWNPTDGDNLYSQKEAIEIISKPYPQAPTILSQANQNLGPRPCVAVELTHIVTNSSKPGWSRTLYNFTRIAMWKHQQILVAIECEPQDAEQFRPTVERIFNSFEFAK